ncbi:MAG: D-glycero-D-manno-heptose 1-phosphate guanosyltransferase [Deltaproteobacteria bacterium]|nr:D-glycero-D-manno-heptose 1-phosphate guanosyltransferase [Deltaproteobacteria bacterium]TLN02284.1 MAG: D-glycero-D-manno-heptose 1-phosphate guanosyltransferase [bacterium]
MKAVVLAGGLGTRLKGRVPNLPKPMAPVAGRPFLEYLLDRLAGAGVHEVILSVGYRWQAIADHFGEEYRGMRLRYAVEVEPLGTGGALAHALNGEGDEPVLVLNGDTLLTVDYSELFFWFLAELAEVGMVLRRVPDAARYGSVVVRDGRVAEFLEKGCSGPGLINAGVYLLKPAIFSRLGLSGRFSLEVDLLQRHREELSPLAFITDAYFIDIGIPEDYDRAQRELQTLQ